MTTVKIDLTQGIIEVSGEEEFVKQVYQDFKESLKKDIHPIQTPVTPTKSTPAVSEPHSKKQSRKTSKNSDSYSIVKDIDLSGGSKESLKDYFDKKQPRSNMEKNTLFVAYLKNTLGITTVTLNHIYTCYKGTGQRVPGALRQSVIDTSSRKGWLETSSLDDISLTVHGENLINHDLPPKVKNDSK